MSITPFASSFYIGFNLGLTARNVYITPLLHAEPAVQFEEFELVKNPNGEIYGCIIIFQILFFSALFYL